MPGKAWSCPRSGARPHLRGVGPYQSASGHGQFAAPIVFACAQISRHGVSGHRAWLSGRASCGPAGRVPHSERVAVLQFLFKQRSRAGRFVVAPDKPSSLKMVLHPALSNAASCRAGVSSSVETRRRGHIRISSLHSALDMQHAKPLRLRAFRR